MRVGRFFCISTFAKRQNFTKKKRDKKRKKKTFQNWAWIELYAQHNYLFVCIVTWEGNWSQNVISMHLMWIIWIMGSKICLKLFRCRKNDLFICCHIQCCVYIRVKRTHPGKNMWLARAVYRLSLSHHVASFRSYSPTHLHGRHSNCSDWPF